MLLASLMILGVRSRRRLGLMLLAAAVAVGAVAAPAPAVADQVDVQAFQPSPFIFDLFTVGKGETEGPTRANVSLYFNYAKNPLVLRETPVGGEESITRSIVSDRLTGDLLGSFRVLDWFAIGLSVPVNVWQAGDGIDGVESPKAFSMGDLRVYPRVRLLRGEGGSYGVAFTPIVTLPTGGSMDVYSGRSGVGVQPTVQGHMAFGPAGVALTLGASFAGDDGLLDLKVGNELLAKLGAWYSVVPEKLDVIVETYGKTALSSPFSNGAQSPFEVDLGVKWRPMPAAFVSAGVGTGVSVGYSAPDLRAFLGFTMAIPDKKEEPKAPPAPDADKDGIPDAADKCPNEPEDKDGFEDADGCPDPDDDKDGVCESWVTERGVADKYADVCKGQDKCPKDPEDKDAFEDEDGCPEPDNDKDGVCDPWVSEKGMADTYASTCKGADKCPLVPEDKDGFEDEDGCPDVDDDKDGVCDAWVAEQGKSAEYAKVCKGADKCPDKKEKHNGLDDEDGCPDQVVQITEKELVIMQSILFVFNKSVILKESYPVLDEVVEILKEHKRIKLISIEGHTDLHGKAGPNMKLSAGRVKAVMDYLAKAGIEKSRLKTKAWGMTKPKIKPEKAPADAQQNRRVEFIILQQDAAAPAAPAPAGP